MPKQRVMIGDDIRGDIKPDGQLASGEHRLELQMIIIRNTISRNKVELLLQHGMRKVYT